MRPGLALRHPLPRVRGGQGECACVGVSQQGLPAQDEHPHLHDHGRAQLGIQCASHRCRHDLLEKPAQSKTGSMY